MNREQTEVLVIATLMAGYFTEKNCDEYWDMGKFVATLTRATTAAKEICKGFKDLG